MRHSLLAPALLSCAAMSFLASCANPPFNDISARTDDKFRHVAQGMPEDEVTQLLGRPDETMRFPLSSTEAWDYRYYDAFGYMAIFSVTFGPDRRVASTISNRVNSGGDHAGSK